jgi:hypothetical protein
MISNNEKEQRRRVWGKGDERKRRIVRREYIMEGKKTDI